VARTAAPSGDFGGLAAPARRALANAGIRNVAQLAKWCEADVAGLHGMGPNAMAILVSILKAKGLSFANKR
jgi:hypothetical protein